MRGFIQQTPRSRNRYVIRRGLLVSILHKSAPHVFNSARIHWRGERGEPQKHVPGKPMLCIGWRQSNRDQAWSRWRRRPLPESASFGGECERSCGRGGSRKKALARIKHRTRSAWLNQRWSLKKRPGRCLICLSLRWAPQVRMSGSNCCPRGRSGLPQFQTSRRPTRPLSGSGPIPWCSSAMAGCSSLDR